MPRPAWTGAAQRAFETKLREKIPGDVVVQDLRERLEAIRGEMDELRKRLRAARREARKPEGE